MPGIKVAGFIGEIPKVLDRLLPNSAASECSNVRLTSGGIEPTRSSVLINEFVAPPDPNDATIYLHNGVWHIWDGLAHAAPGPVASDRLYVTGDGVPKMIINPDEYDLKIIAPTAKLTLTPSGGGSGDITTRLYVYTFVTSFGEESEPCPISDDLEWQDGQTVTLSGFELGDPARGVTTQRIYRSQQGPSGTQLYFIDERATSVSDYVDSIGVEDIQEPLPSLTWNNPPDALEGLTVLPNGIMAGFVGKTLYFSEPYHPHAWPEVYSFDVDFPIMALGAFSNSLVVATEGNPYLVTGSNPLTMFSQKLELNLPCVSKRSMVDLGYTVAYASRKGLVAVSSGGANIVSSNLFSHDDWAELNPTTFAAGQINGWYYVSYDYLDYDGALQQGSFYLDLTGNQAFLVRSDVITRSFFYDLTDEKLYYYKDGNAYEWDGTVGIPSLYTWKSKTFTFPKPTNLGAIKVLSSKGLTTEELAQIQAQIDAIILANEALFSTGLEGEVNSSALGSGTLNGDLLVTPPSLDQNIAINIYGDGVLRGSVDQLNVIERLPSGYKATDFYIEIIGNAQIDQVESATTAKELGQV